MHDQVTQPDNTPVAGTPGAGAGAPASGPASNAAPDVLKIIADVEGHLTRLRSAQRQQDDAVSSLAARSKALRAGEEELDRQRVAFKQQAMQIERDRATLQQERDQFGEQCRRIDEELRRRASEVEQAQQKLERERSDSMNHAEQAKRGASELEQAKTVWQQTRAQMEEQLQRSQADINQRLAECAKAKDEIAATRSQWEQQKQHAQGKIDARALELDQQMAAVAQREGNLQQERDRLAMERQQSQRQQQELQNRAAALEQERGDLLGRVDQAERNVGELIEQVERSQHELIEQTRLVKKTMDKVAEMQQRERAVEKALEESKVAVLKAERESHDLLHLADGERSEMQAKLVAAGKELKQAHETRDAALGELDSTRKKIVSMQRDLRSRDEEIAARDGQLADLQKKVEMAGSKMSEFADVLSEQTPQLERGAAAMAMCQEQAEQIDRLTKQLAELQLASDPAEIQRRDARIVELTEALRQARGQNGGETIVAEIEQRNALLQQEVQQLRLDTQNAQIAAEEARKQLQAYVDSGAEAQVKDVALAEHAARVASLTAEIERLHSAAAKELDQKLSVQSKKHQQELASAREAEQEMAAMRERLADLEVQLARSKAQTANAEANGGDADAEYAARLRSKAEQITAVADHLRRRRVRLERMRMLMRQRQKAMPVAGAQGTAQMRAEQAGQVEKERQHLLEVRKMLAASEYQMIRRWARQRAAFTMACLAMVVAVSAGAAWLAVSYFYPPQMSASVVVEARSRGGLLPLTDEQMQEWTAWHADLASDASFQGTLAKRMGDRQLTDWSRTEAIAAQLKHGFSVDSSKPGMVIYTMSGTDSTQLTTFLDVFAGTVLAESSRQASSRSDNAMAVATGEHKDEGQTHYASLNAEPIHDERMQRVLPIFGGTLGGMLLLTLVSYVKFSRSKRVFEEETAGLFQDLRPVTPAPAQPQ